MAGRRADRAALSVQRPPAEVAALGDDDAFGLVQGAVKTRRSATGASQFGVDLARQGIQGRVGAPDLPPFDDDVWELYDGATDWTQAHDLASEMPDKLHELQRLWLIEAVKYNVLPLDDRAAE